MEIYQYGIQETVQGRSSSLLRPAGRPAGSTDRPPRSRRATQGRLRADSLPFSLRDWLADVMKGYNGTVFSYGQTGSGASLLRPPSAHGLLTAH